MPTVVIPLLHPPFAPSSAFHETPINDDHILASAKTSNIAPSPKNRESGNRPGNPSGNDSGNKSATSIDCYLCSAIHRHNSGHLSGHLPATIPATSMPPIRPHSASLQPAQAGFAARSAFRRGHNTGHNTGKKRQAYHLRSIPTSPQYSCILRIAPPHKTKIPAKTAKNPATKMATPPPLFSSHGLFPPGEGDRE